ncbi:MAG: histidyl-tRNA synthetase [Myxococcales bacterium]|jgi:histidyl-tRNA synthetase|nr:histidyl-tRNA synthetase [Myxococcales bacterium]
MADVPPSVKGMNDILAPEVSKWHFLEEKARSILESFSYRELRTPVLEYTPLFVRSVGEVTDVVEKQMYTFDDRDGRSVTLRPEGTAPAVRAYVERAQWNKEPVTRWYYIGPMFRHERAQRGRLRQFHQVGAELFGIAEPSADAELIAMLHTFLVELGLPASEIQLSLNSLGEPGERAAYRDALVAYLTANEDKLDEESRRRLTTNPLRVLDSKNPEVTALVAGAPVLLDTLGDESKRRFERVQEILKSLGVGFEVDPRLVRGLDYYTGTVFEFKTNAGDLGAQNTVGGGGRYDGLVESLGGPRVPALGFGLGIERTLLALKEPAESFEPALSVFVAPMDAAALAFALPIAHKLRLGGIRVEIEHRLGSLKSQLKRADRLKARLAIIVGETEVAAKKVQLKDFGTGKQHEVAVDEIETRVRGLLD